MGNVLIKRTGGKKEVDIRNLMTNFILNHLRDLVEKNKANIKGKKIPKKKINIYTGNPGIRANNSNTFLQHIKNINCRNYSYGY